MVKKNTIETSIEINITGSSVSTIHAIRLETGLWRHLFADEQNKLMIANSLNYCVYKGLYIVGYLITENNIYLVLKADAESLNRMLNMFDDTLRKEIKHQQEYIKNHKSDNQNERFKSTDAFMGLFTKHHLTNYKLVQLITGQSIHTAYHDPHLMWLKDRLRKAEFCSLIDYSGAKGPVEISGIENIG